MEKVDETTTGQEQTITATPAEAAAQIPAEKPAAAEVAKPVERETPSQIAAMQAKMDAHEKTIEGRYAKAAYIIEKCDDLPRDILDAMLPATADTKALSEAAHKVRDSLGAWIQALIKQGKILRKPSPAEYSGGGNPPGAEGVNLSHMSAMDLLKMRQ